MGWFSKRGRDRAQEPRNAARTDEPQKRSPEFLAKVDEVIAAAEGLSSSADSKIQGHFDYVSTEWGCEEILVLDKAAIRELLCRVAKDDLEVGFGTFVVLNRGGVDENKSSYVQLNSVDMGNETVRSYRIVKRKDGRLAFYGHAALYQAKRAIDRAHGSHTPSRQEGAGVVAGDPVDAGLQLGADELINKLIAISRVEGALLAPRGSELRARIQAVGAALNDVGGQELMLQAHSAVLQSLGRVRARELEAAWDGVGSWLG